MRGKNWKMLVTISLSKLINFSPVTVLFYLCVRKTSICVSLWSKNNIRQLERFYFNPIAWMPRHERREIWKGLHEASEWRAFGDNSFGSWHESLCVAGSYMEIKDHWKSFRKGCSDGRQANGYKCLTWPDDHGISPVQCKWQYISMLPESSVPLVLHTPEHLILRSSKPFSCPSLCQNAFALAQMPKTTLHKTKWWLPACPNQCSLCLPCTWPRSCSLLHFQ